MTPPSSLSTEIHRRQSNTAKVVAYFREHEGEWIDTRTLEKLGGRNAWRTRVANARAVFCAELGWEYPVIDGPDPIENRQTRLNYEVVSEYRYRPWEPLGRSASVEPADQQPLFR